MTSTKPKIFGIGLSKTGTSSLDVALNALGMSSIHYPRDQTTYRELAAGNYRLTVLEEFQSATDISVAPFYAQLDQIYPNSKFILTVRDVDSWLESARQHWEFMWQWAEHDQQFNEFTKFITACTYGTHAFQRERFRYVYNLHVKNVREYFAHRPNDLLILDICAGEGWERLCPFLNVPIPSQPFPHANRRGEKQSARSWIEWLSQAVDDFRTAVPASAHYVLVDDAQLAGSALDGPRVRRLMERDGQYWGRPADSAAAIAELERLRETGADFLVIAWSSFWWLEFYVDFAAYLKKRFATVLENERLLVFDLRVPNAGNDDRRAAGLIPAGKNPAAH